MIENVVTVPAFQLIGMGWTGPFLGPSARVNKMREAFINRSSEITYQVNREFFVCPHHGRPTEFSYYMGFEVLHGADVQRVPEGMVHITVPMQTYAKFTHVGPMEKIQETYERIHAWLKRENKQIDTGFLSIEIYPKHIDASWNLYEPLTNEMDILIPLKNNDNT